MSWMRPFTDDAAWAMVFGAWLLASVSTLGALFFSDVMQVAPCVLCWYQRIFMFPLVLLLPIGMFPFDRKVVRYALPLAALGGLVAAYHTLLAAGLIPEDLKPCTQGLSCAEQAIEWFGFVTIPLLSLVAFSIIVTLLAFAYRRSSA